MTEPFFRKIASLPIADQKAVVENKPFEVAVAAKTGHVDHKLVAFSNMTDQQRKAVFSRGCVRSPEQQWQALVEEKPQKMPVVKITVTHQLLKRSQKTGASPADIIRKLLEDNGLA